MSTLSERLASLGVTAPVEWNTDKPTRNGSQWFIGKGFQFGDELVQVAWFGDYKTGSKEEWRSEPGRPLTEDEKKELESQIKRTLETEKKAREDHFNERAKELQAQFNTFSPRGLTPYLVRKGITQLFGARVAPNEHGEPILAVPMYDVLGNFWNFQRIYAQKLSAGDKFFGEAARIDETFFVLHQRPLSGERAYLCEGFATAASVQMALPNETVVACFNAANLVKVAKAIHAAHPKLKLYICGDNDAYTKKDGQPFNVGLKYAREACGHVDGELLYPIFANPTVGRTDFNDLQLAQSLDDVRDQLLHPDKHRTEVEPLSAKVTKSGRVEIPSEKKVADYLLKFFNGKLTQQTNTFFMYGHGYWQELRDADLYKLKQAINTAASDLLGSREVESYLKTLMTYTPGPTKGVSLFTPNPFAANFANGTLHMTKVDDKYTLTFAKHNPQDYLTSVLPFNFPGWDAIASPPATPLFDALIDQLWGESIDKTEKYRLACQILGAALIPAFPHIAIFTGPPSSGKSTLIKLIAQMVSQENISGVQMSDMLGFNMESMVGKLVNIDMDIDIHRPINDSMVKKITDRFPFIVRRKNRLDLKAYLPALHLFAANGLPKSLDGASRAYGRRMSIILTEPPKADRPFMQDYEQFIWTREAQGIICHAVKGMQDLASTNGKYTVPASSIAKVHEMESDSDLVAQFLDDVKHGEVRDNNTLMVLEPEASVERTVLWEMAKEWRDHTVPTRLHWGKIQFFAGLEAHGYKIKTVKGVRMFVGIGAHARGKPDDHVPPEAVG